MLKNVTVILPSYEPDFRLGLVVQGVLDAGFTDIVIVNDGSSQENIKFFEEASQHKEVTVITHEVNKGKGRALKTAFNYVLENRPDSLGVVTIDGDNQHHPDDIKACALEMTSSHRVVLGCRDFTLPEVPWKSRNGNNITKFVFRVFCGIKISDTQTGLRAIPFDNLQSMVETDGERYEFETNMLLEMKNLGIEFSEVKIRTLYEDKENSTSHFHPFRDSLKIYRVIFKYLFSSIFSTVLDLLLFFIGSVIFERVITGGFTLFSKDFSRDWSIVFIASSISRVVSSVVNYKMNEQMVFKSKSKGSAIRYAVLCTFQLAVSASCVSILSTLLHADSFLKTVLKCIIDLALFFISFRIQRAWVFPADSRQEKI